MTVVVELHHIFTVNNLDPDKFEAEGSALMDALLDLEKAGACSDSAVSIDIGRRRIEIEVVGVGDNFEEAAERADSCIRTAIHAVGGATPTWEPVTISEHRQLVDA